MELVVHSLPLFTRHKLPSGPAGMLCAHMLMLHMADVKVHARGRAPGRAAEALSGRNDIGVKDSRRQTLKNRVSSSYWPPTEQKSLSTDQNVMFSSC